MPRHLPFPVRRSDTLEIVDLFCGAGGTSTGILQAILELGLRCRLTAVNHWKTAINTHSINLVSDHKHGIDVRHICEPVENLWPARVITSRRLHLLCASCECTFHSLANGGKPCKEQSRSQPWQLLRWCSDIQVDNILMENVPTFLDWCPLLTKGIMWQGKYHKKNRPDPRRKGETFRAFVQALRNLGYIVEWKIQCAGDFGDPTSRQRLMLYARLNRKIDWPAPSHGEMKPVSTHRVECQSCGHTWNLQRHACCPQCRLEPHKAAHGCIDFSIPGKSIWRADGSDGSRPCARHPYQLCP